MNTNKIILTLLFIISFANSLFAATYEFKDWGMYFYSGRDGEYYDGNMFGKSGIVNLDLKLNRRLIINITHGEKKASPFSIRINAITDTLNSEGEPWKIYTGTITKGSLAGLEAIVYVQKKFMSIFVEKEFKIFFDFGEYFYEDGIAFGSGFAINDHTIITNQHVISGLDLFWANKYNGSEKKDTELEVVYQDPLLDIAVLHSKDSLMACEVDRNIYDIGEEVITYGFPQIKIQGESLKATKGIISSRMGYQNSADSYQIDAAIQPGNSGGPLTRNDKIIGIVSSRLEGESQLVNYAIKSIFLGAILDVLNIKNTGTAKPNECTYSIQGQSYRYYNEKHQKKNEVENYIQEDK